MSAVRTIQHNRIHLALHELRAGHGRPLLLLHGLGQHTGQIPGDVAELWTGPVFGLDFTGHGRSDNSVGGGYTVEILVADADAALAEIGPSTVVGRGLGGYVALLLAGVRAPLVHGAVVADGPGLLGGGPSLAGHQVLPAIPVGDRSEKPDPWAMLELAKDLRPADYAAMFVRMALDRGPVDEPIAVVARARPPWLAAVVEEVGVTVAASVAEALRTYGAEG